MKASKDAEFLQGVVFGVFVDFNTGALDRVKDYAERFELFKEKGEAYFNGLELAEWIFTYLSELKMDISASDFLKDILILKRTRARQPLGFRGVDIKDIILKKAVDKAWNECLKWGIEALCEPVLNIHIDAIREEVGRKETKLKVKEILKARDDDFLYRVSDLSRGVKAFFKECGADLDLILNELKKERE